jgi:hypothetical protein
VPLSSGATTITEVPTLKKLLLAAMMVALLGSAVATSAHARSTDPYTTALARQVAWQQQHIEKLEKRHPAVVGTLTSYSPSPSVSGCLSDSQIASYARAAGFPESVIPTMVDIAAHRGPSGTGESGGCPGAINSSSGACGLWQIYPCPGPDALNPYANARYAYEKYRLRGLSPWS